MGVVALDLATFKVTDVVLGSETRLRDGILAVNAEDLKSILLANDAFEDVSIDVARPGESVRLIHVVDVVEPRMRVLNPGSDFPGLLGRLETVGTGRTHRRSGVAVVEVAEPVPGEASHCSEAIIDMAGEGVKYSHFSN